MHYRMSLGRVQAERRWVKEWITGAHAKIIRDSQLFKLRVLKWQVARSRELLQPHLRDKLKQEQAELWGELQWECNDDLPSSADLRPSTEGND